MNGKRIERLLEPGVLGYFLVFLLFCAVLLFFDPIMGGVGLALLIVVYIIQTRRAIRRRRELLRYIEGVSQNADVAAGSVMSSPFPTVVIRLDTGDIVWYNRQFGEITSDHEHIFETRLADVAPGLSLGWLIAGRNEAPELINIGERWYSVGGTTERIPNDAKILATLYFIDRTVEHSLREISDRTRPAVGIFMLDNYEELTKGLSEQQKSALIAELDEKLNAWFDGADCMFRKYEKDRYVMVCEKSLLDRFMAEKFSVLDSVRTVGSADNPLTLSIGFGIDGDGYGEIFEFASLAIDMALSRGGDQAVVKDRVNFTFFGGKTQELEKRTKVKSRVMANALRRLISDSSSVYIMGHKNSDLDSIGAAVGIVCACRRLDRKAHIIVDLNMTAAALLINRITAQPEYAGVFISPSDAMVHMDARSLLVVVDTNRPEVVEAPEILESCPRIAVIDHHRRAASYISNAALNIHEPYASSASELVCELLGYFDNSKVPLLKIEAEALLGGIVLDSKNFTLRTGVRTFEAAATLRLAGADPVEIKKLFQTEYADYVERYRIIASAVPYREHFAIATLDENVGRVVAAQAADGLLDVLGIQASFVVFNENGQAIISARSLGQVNVQLIVEKLGGGGHLTMAGAQLPGVTPEEASERIRVAIDEVIRSIPQ